MIKKTVATLTVSTAFFVALMRFEGFSPTPYRDSVGVPTIGIGSTTYPNGARVSMSDKPISQDVAIDIARDHISADEKLFKESLAGAKLSQGEYDLYLDFVYQYGINAFAGSSMRRLILQNKHKEACTALLRWRFAGGKDCAIRANNCYGVYTRQLSRYEQCVRLNP